MEQVRGTLDRVQDMNAGLRDFIDDKGNNIFDGMAKEKK
jgi:hypothetical protein